ncbi:tubby-like protein [Encephalitozoon intestinalis ATCC 50506]|uniref:Tubby-like protein n=1 Tax=Encephalitozoon intestinalis (strain ATCC 50506) TaxID=876142 RepID=E0S7H4_ENCIT|nr:tubby-like protein [Encephalitozoon intestinalis ATCC 50506]ADM11653.1 tubby-like protein [Encephalitozoon intestinalis ATCC 50506]UTX45387.1 tubby-like protein [Encephalitozoon intestinalis]
MERESRHVTVSIDHAHDTGDGEQCSLSPVVYEFSYSPSENRVIEYLDNMSDSGAEELNIVADDGHALEERIASVLEPYPVGRTSRGRVDVCHGFFNEYLYESHEYGPNKLFKAYRVMCGFEIYLLGLGNEEKVGYLRSNLFGTKYILHQGEKAVLEIKYATSIFKRRGPRSFSVMFMGVSGSSLEEPVVMKNKEPYYNAETNSYSLNFNGRVTTPSVKNFQLIHPLEPTYVTLTFGKISRFKYILDYTYPWSGLQAFAIALAALDYKVGCD